MIKQKNRSRMSIYLASLSIILTLLSSTVRLAFATVQNQNFAIETRVNQDVVTNVDLQQRKLLYQILKVKLQKEEANIKTLLINETLQKQFAQSQGIFITNVELKSEIEIFLNEQMINKEHLIKKFNIENVAWESFESHVKSRVIWKKTLLSVFGRKAVMRDYELNLPPLTTSNNITKLLNLSEIVIPFAERGKTKSLLLANRLKIELTAGKDFTVAAKRFSRSQSRSNGGLIGFIDEKNITEELKKVLRILSLSEISAPYITTNTVVIFKLNERKEKKSFSNLDYLMNFTITTDGDTDGTKLCGENPANNNSVLLSKLDEKSSAILRKAALFKRNLANNGSWLILCQREIRGSESAINQKKSKHFNKEMIKFSKRLMLKLYREAIIH